MKCDFCGEQRGRIKTKRNFPHGRKSKGITTKTCQYCKSKKEESK